MAAASVAAPAAYAHQNPSTCGGNESDFRIIRDPSSPARPGDQVTFIIYAANTGVRPCDITTTSPLVVTLPAKDGTATGAQTTVRPTNTNFAAGYPFQEIARVPWTADLNPGVKDAVTTLSADANLHDAAVDHQVQIFRSLGTDITRPSMVLTKVASPTSGVAPLTVTYTYTLANTGDANIANVRVSDDRCSPLALVSGDTNNDKVL